MFEISKIVVISALMVGFVGDVEAVPRVALTGVVASGKST